MVVYKCVICFKEFSNKSEYTRHIAREKSCEPYDFFNVKLRNYKCKICHKEFNRKDHFNKHLCVPPSHIPNFDIIADNNNGSNNSCNNDNSSGSNNDNSSGSNNSCNNDNSAGCNNRSNSSNNNDSNNGSNNASSNNGNTNNITNNTANNNNIYINILPCANNYTDCVSLNVEVRFHVSLHDYKSQIQNILSSLNDLLIPKDDESQMQKILASLNDFLRPKNNNDFEKKGKEILFTHIKEVMVNDCITKPVINNNHNLFQESGYTIQDVERKIKAAKQLKEISYFLLASLLKQKLINLDNRGSLYLFIKKTHDICHLNIIIRLLGNSLCFGDFVNLKVINKELCKQKIIDKYINEHFL